MTQQAVKDFIQATLKLSFEPALDVPKAKEFGHYATNVAMRLAKELKSSPLDIATKFAQQLKLADKKGMFSSIEAVAPGFINFTLSQAYLASQLERIFKKGFTFSDIGDGNKVIIEYASLNIAKPAHVGHLRSMIIGEALSNMYQASGYKVTRWNWIGDWGTQFGKLISAYKMWGDRASVERDPIETLLALYVRFHDEIKHRPDLENVGQEEFRKLEQGDKENRELWQWFKDESMIAFNKLFTRLGIHFDVDLGEGFFERDLPAVLKLLKQTIAKPGEGGSVIVPLEQFNLPPALVQKTDGASLYITRDIATALYRAKKYKPVKILHVVANDQALHFSQLFAIDKLLGIKTESEHIKYGMVLGEDGKKFSTREGRAIRLEELMDKIVELAAAKVKEKNSNLSDQRQREIAEIVGIGALKYNDLKENRQSDIIFNWEQMLDFAGDSAPYLQYTYARLMSILEKAGKIGKADLNQLTEPVEQELAKKILDLPDVVALCVETNYTSHLAKYVFDLAKLTSQFYEQVRVLNDENTLRKNARLILISSVAQAMKQGLGLLGIRVLERI